MLLIIEIMRRDFNENHQMQVLVTVNQLGTKRMMSQIAEQVGMEYLEVPDSRFVAQLVNEIFFRGKKNVQWRTQSQSKRMRGSLNPGLHCANHQDNHGDRGQDQLCASLRTCKTPQLLHSSLICEKVVAVLCFVIYFFLHLVFLR